MAGNPRGDLVKGSKPGRQPTAPPTPPGPRVSRRVLLAGLAGGFGTAFGRTKLIRHRSALPGMVWIEGGEFTMGSADASAPAAEKPAHRVRVDGFWVDETDVTNAQFRAFVDATGYATTDEGAVGEAFHQPVTSERRPPCRTEPDS